MKKLYSFFSIMLLSTLVFSVMVTVVLAGGGQVTGSKGSGQVNQNCVHPDGSGVCPFGG